MSQKKMGTDIQIAREASMRPIQEIGKILNIPDEDLFQYGPHKAKISGRYINSLQSKQDEGKLILVTAITPTPAGEGKTTTTIGLGDALNRIGKKAIMCLREPSLGPCFGVKGGAAGGGYSQVVPMEDINLHFTGDFHAIGAANNLLAAAIDNHIYWGNELQIDERRIEWNRVVDMNDRALRNVVCSLGGLSNGYPREDSYDITVASEVMAIFCLAETLDDLQKKLGNIIVAYTRGKKPITARDLKMDGAMTVLLKDAFMPNLVQTLENNPVMIHGGPFANIAHGCNSVIATKSALKMADYVVTEAGFGADLGAEKFFNIKCRKAKLKPAATVVVGTIRALKMQGGVKKADLALENTAALKDGFVNLARHIENIRKFKVPVVVAINKFVSDTDEEVQTLTKCCNDINVDVFLCTHWSDGGAGTQELAEHVVKMVDKHDSDFKYLYQDDLELIEKVRTIAQDIYGADDISLDKKVTKKLSDLQGSGFGHLPVCMAKTQYSFSTDPKALGAPSKFIVPIKNVRLSAGAEFVVIITGDVMTMPGLPRVPAANHIGLDSNGNVEGLF
ncbi:MAG: formate--tetrahydrofolate ligase [Bacteriovoracaceae bacterium]|nr:formate--tetrahydrofolate ligase [Bacteriovoracaceae bacterium]